MKAKQRFELRRRCKHIHQVKEKGRVIGTRSTETIKSVKGGKHNRHFGLILQELAIDHWVEQLTLQIYQIAEFGNSDKEVKKPLCSQKALS